MFLAEGHAAEIKVLLSEISGQKNITNIAMYVITITGKKEEK